MEQAAHHRETTEEFGQVISMCRLCQPILTFVEHSLRQPFVCASWPWKCPMELSDPGRLAQGFLSLSLDSAKDLP